MTRTTGGVGIKFLNISQIKKNTLKSSGINTHLYLRTSVKEETKMGKSIKLNCQKSQRVIMAHHQTNPTQPITISQNLTNKKLKAQSQRHKSNQKQKIMTN